MTTRGHSSHLRLKKRLIAAAPHRQADASQAGQQAGPGLDQRAPPLAPYRAASFKFQVATTGAGPERPRLVARMGGGGPGRFLPLGLRRRSPPHPVARRVLARTLVPAPGAAYPVRMTQDHALARDFSLVRTWIFDLDHTLYPPSARLFDQLERRMTAWVMRELGLDHASADRLRADYWATYGTTLAGLMAVHGIDPLAYLDDVHQIDLSGLEADPGLARAISALPGRRIVFTNADRDYAFRVIRARGLSHCFDAVHGVVETGFQAKPGAPAYDRVIALERIDPRSAAMFEDDLRNLVVPQKLGMKGILVGPAAPADAPVRPDHQTDDLAGFLSQIVVAAFP
jgi:putative hydrolase of the HAD superfamily